MINAKDIMRPNDLENLRQARKYKYFENKPSL